MRLIDRAGHVYGRLTVLAQAPKRGRRVRWLCRCECGTVVSVVAEKLGKSTRSCGCLCKDTTRQRSVTHGAMIGRARPPEYKAWQHAKGRCYNPNDPKFPTYGGRGIKMCEQWRNDFAAFLADMGPRPSIRHSIDRIDNTGDYEPGNCRWATLYQQAQNKRNNLVVHMRDGRMLNLKEAARAFGVNYSALHNIVRYRGRDPLKALHAMARRKHSA